MQTLSILIPAYNEERSIKEILTRVKKANLSELNLKKEIIVVDDGSTDKTVAIASKIKGVSLIKHKKNYGKGAAIRTALKNATGDIIFIQDADLEYNPQQIARVVAPIVNGKTLVSYGSRYLDKTQKTRNKSFLKKIHKNAYLLFYIGGRAITAFANLLYNAKITDEATCYKAFHAGVLKNIELKCKGFEFCPEVTAKVIKQGYKIFEVPITYTPRSFEDGKKIKFRDGFEAIWTLLKYRFIR